MFKSGDQVSFKRVLPNEQVEVEGEQSYRIVPGEEFTVEGRLGYLPNLSIPIIESDGHRGKVRFSDLTFGRKGAVSFKRTFPDKTKVDDEGNETIIKGKTITVRAKLGDLAFLSLPVIEEDGTEIKVAFKDLTFKEGK